MSMDILRATKIKYGAIHSVDHKPMSGTFDSRDSDIYLHMFR